MRTRVATIVGLLAVLALAVPVAGCGEEEGEEVPEAVEGEPLHVGDLIYNVSITRFLNPNITEDEAYLEGAPEEPTGKSYLGVFLQIKNETDEPLPSAGEYSIVDGSHRVYEPSELETDFSLEIGAEVPADGVIPLPDSVPASGPTQGALLLFLVDDDVSEERPLELEVVSSGEGEGLIELDI
ncbi:MAG: hypothetical protein M3Y34_05410 [Actinomycetota bacterium]|nr:hypothetical protein [Actinomycetota bacterium]